MQKSTYSIRMAGVDHETHRAKIVRVNSGAAALATDPATQQPVGVLIGGGTYTTTDDTVAIGGPAQVLVGTAGLTAGFHRVTCDAASKAVTAGRTAAAVGYAILTAAASENDLIEIFVAPHPALDAS